MIAFLGAGKLAEAIIRGALAAGALSRKEILVTCRRPERAAELRALGLKVASHFTELEPAEVAILGVRHRDMAALLTNARSVLSRKSIISLAIGVPSSLIERLVPGARVIRAIANTPAMVGLAMTTLLAGASATPVDMACMLSRALWRKPDARLVWRSRWLFSLRPRRSLEPRPCWPSPIDPSSSSSPRLAGKGGSTQAALDVLEQGGLDSLLANAVKAALARAQERNAESQPTDVTPAST